MKDVFKLLKLDFQIIEITLKNFALFGEELMLLFKVNILNIGERTIVFQNVKWLNINADYYTSSQKPVLVIEDIRAAQMEGLDYKVSLSEDVMVFYCQSIFVET